METEKLRGQAGLEKGSWVGGQVGFYCQWDVKVE